MRPNIPTSPGQEALCLLQQVFPESSAYNVPLAWWLDAPVDRRALRIAFQALLDRHEPLRTAYPLAGDGFAQRVEDGATVDFVVHTGEEATEALLAALQDEAEQVFDLTTGPVLRVRLWQRATAPSLLSVVAHHVALDGWSIRLLLEELGVFYAAAHQGTLPEIAALPRTFQEVVTAEAERLAGDAGARQRRYWTNQLRGAPTRLELAADYPRSAVPSGRGAAVPGRLEAPLVARVQTLAGRYRTTPFTVLVAVFQALLGRYSGQREFLLGTPTAGRRGSAAAALIGYFVNPVVLRCDLRGDPSSEGLIARTREVVLDAFDHQDYPFQHLAGELESRRDFGHHPVFQVVFAMLPPPPPGLPDLYAGRMGFPGGQLELGALVLEPVPLEEGAARFDMTLLVAQRGDALVLRLQYDAGLFTATTARRLLGHYRTLLTAAVEQPEVPLSVQPLLTAAERHLLRCEWNGGRAVPPPQGSVLERFALQVRQRPHGVALVAGDERLTYGELAHRVAHLAARLRDTEIGAETRVGICMERTADLVTAILGVLAVGATYVPLDPAYPSQRLRFLLEDCGARLVLTDAPSAARLPPAPTEGWQVQRVEDWLLGMDRGGAESLSLASVAPSQLAYIIYTSGSTGRPKGVGVTHGNLVRLLSATQPWFHFGPEAVWTFFHSYAFDFSVWELWGALAYGGRLVMVPESVRTSPADFWRLLRMESVTVLNQTPSAFRQLMRADEEAGAAAPTALRHVIFGGEALELESLRPWIRRHGDQQPRLVNMYGITETTVHVTHRPICRADLERAGGSVIGEPIPDLTLHVLDRHLRLTPIGVPGELCIGGAGLARGYLGRPGLTAERFIPDPVGERPGARLYRSGDLGRRRGDGDLEFLGRIDFQVKVRGHRIELGEVEAALGEHPALREVAVLTLGTGEETRLVAYVVPGGASAEGPTAGPSIESMRERVERRLPAYMVPAVFMVLEALPLTPHGKLDRAALPAPAADRDALGQAYVAPRTALEAALAAAWGEVLELERIGIEDPFSALGGDSIRSVRVVSAARRRGIEISLQDLFQRQTIAALAHRASALSEGEARVPADRPAPPFQLPEEDRRRLPSVAVDAVDAYPLSALQAGMLVEGERAARTPLYHNVNGMHLRAPLVPAALRQAIGALLDRHPVLRSAFHTAGFSEPLQIVHREVVVRCPVLDLSALGEGDQEREIDRWLAVEKTRRYTLPRAPLMRFVAHRLGRETFHLGLSEHHVLADGWSMAVVRSELLQLYAAALGDPAPPLPPAPRATFAAFIAAERQAVADPAARDFWRRKMAGAPRARLPRPARPPVQAPRTVKYQPVVVTAATLAGLQQRARAAGVSLKSVLLSAHLQVQALLTGERDLVTGMVTHGRPEVAGSERIVGLFVNSLPLRLEVPPSAGHGLVTAVARAEQALLAHRAFPLAEIQALAGGGRLFESLFNFVHFHVSDTLRRLTKVELLERRIHAETELPLVATFKLLPAGDRLEARLEGDLGEFTAAGLARFAALYERALLGLAASPEAAEVRENDAARAVDARLPPGERHRLRVEWPAGPEAPPALPLTTLFARQVAQRPTAPALVAAGREWSYGALDAEANRLAHYLRRRGIGREDRVGLLLERSADAILGILAILKVGGAYVPLDPGYPEPRLRGMLEDAAVRLLLTRGVPSVARSAARICLEADGAAIAAESTEALPLTTAVDDLAYVMFTSGSTGRPKAVAVPHRAVARLVADGPFAHFGPGESWLQFAPLSFDASTLEIWGALARGGRLVVAPAGATSLSVLAATLREQEVTSLWLTAGLFHQMVDEMPQALAPLRQLLAGGDVLSPAHARRLLDTVPGIRLVNGYGPTENTTFTCCHPMIGATGAASITTSVPLGRPIVGTRVYVVDETLRPVPTGVPGELLTGGEGLARGYLGSPARTAESFVPDPFSAAPGGRLYRTGDGVRWDAEGRLEFLGRRDGQVKVRGFRIETAAVAQALEDHEAVREAVVVVRGEGAEGKELVAYVVPQAGAPDTEALRAFAAETLPSYMVPNRFCLLESLPLDPNGKLDRRALPEPEGAPQRGGGPRGPVEELVVGVWSGLLGESLGVEDDVFALGAHSLTVVRAASRLGEALDREIPLDLLFEHPTPALQAVALATTPAVASVLSVARPEPLVALPRPSEMPLSPAQERLWFFSRYEPEAPTYNVPLVYGLRGPVAVPALAHAIAALVDRHEVLRTVYRSHQGQPVQRVLSAETARTLGGLARIDLSGLPAQRRRALGHTLAERAVRRPFNLAAGLPWRALLIQRGGEDSLLAMAVHHIAFDGGSVAVLHHDLAAFYRQDGGAAPAVEPLAVQYGDYARWQRQGLETPAARRSMEYWRERLRGSGGLELTGDRSRPAVRASAGGAVSRPLPEGSWAAVEALSQERAATRFMVFATVFAALLARWTERGDVVFGTPSGQRTPAAVEPLVGCFLNPLLLRLDAAGDPTFAALLRRVRQQTLADYPHASLPFERLVEELVPRRDLARPPLFQILFAVDDPVPLQLPGVVAEPVQISLQAAKYDLAVEVLDTHQRPAVRATFATDLYDGTSVTRLLGAFATLFGEALQHPQRPLSRLALLRPEERQQMLHEWNDAARLGPFPPTHRAFEAWVTAAPTTVAVEAEDGVLRYAELDRRASHLAHRLRQLGAGPEVGVGVALPRTTDLLVGLLGVLKAGAFYVPLDLDYPTDRLAYVLQDSGVRFVVTHRALLTTLPESAALPVLLKEIDEEVAEPSRPPVPVDTHHLAYAIYTSGSTGRPKGVQVSHGALANYIADLGPRVGLGAGGRLLAVTPLSFDISGFELLAPLALGGTVVLASREIAVDGVALAARLTASRIDVLQATPATWRQLVARGWGPTPGLTALCGGEALPPALAREVMARCDHLWNLYGPTETTIFSTAAPLRDAASDPLVTLGRPIANTRVHAVDQALEACPVGVPGEILLGGSGLARGYLNRPAMTAERFVPDPFSGRAGERLYRTGDVGQWLADGRLHYLGRRDYQVKLRGFRIELGEIEAVLETHPEVEGAVVTLRGQGGVEAQLVAWYTAPEALPVDGLTALLRQRLPAYMVPGAFVHLDAFPQTPNNKVDRRALPDPGGERPPMAVRYLAPRSALERSVAAVYRQVLGLDQVGLHDNFFDLGGNSLLAVEVLDQLPGEASHKPTLVDLFRFPTVGSLAGLLQGETGGENRLTGVTERADLRRRARRARGRAL